jgi:2,3-bisphosphoglycerate-dependent phosphoglycerate mutase
VCRGTRVIETRLRAAHALERPPGALGAGPAVSRAGLSSTFGFRYETGEPESATVRFDAVLNLVLLRHGESLWNAQNLFTGWVDVELSERGEAEAVTAGKLLAAEPDLDLWTVHTSVLVRAITTAELALRALGRSWIDVRRHWRLNERHYGALQGSNKKEMTAEHGEEQVHLWRRSYAVPPPSLDPADAGHPRNDPRYRDLPPDSLPATECLADVVRRVLPYWEDAIVPDLRANGARGSGVLVVAHGNSLRALRKHIDQISDAAIPDLEIPTGIPFLYRFDDDFRVVESRYLGDPEAATEAAEAVRRQSQLDPDVAPTSSN